MKLIFPFMVTLIPIIAASGLRQVHECTQINHFILPKSQCRLGSQVPSQKGPMIYDPSSLKQCRVKGLKTVTVNTQGYLKLLHEKVFPCLREKNSIDIVTFMQNGATSHTANQVKEFLIQTFGEDRIISKR